MSTTDVAIDVVVVLPGILGSTLNQDGHLVWAPSAGSTLRAIDRFGTSVKRLQLPAGIGDDHPGDGVEPVGLMPDLHVLPGVWAPVKGFGTLLARLRSFGYREPSPGAAVGNLIPVAYDWRLSCRYNGRRLARIIGPALERWRDQGGPYADAQVVFVCHAMGGLVARWYMEMCGGAEITRKLITLGTPYRGAARVLAQLINGAPVGLGPFRTHLTGFARSLPSLHQLMPEYACIEKGDGLAKTTDIMLPELDTAMVTDAMRFHAQLQDAEARRRESLTSTHAIVGTDQHTATTARLAGGLIELIDTYRGEDLYGDSTVPIIAARRPDVAIDSSMLYGVPDKHGDLQQNTAALDKVEGILTGRSIIEAVKPVGLRVDVPEFALSGEDVAVWVTPTEPSRRDIHFRVTSEVGELVEQNVVRPTDGTITARVRGLAPGAYTVDVTGSSSYASVSSNILIWPGVEDWDRPLHAAACVASSRAGAAVSSPLWPPLPDEICVSPG